MNTFKIFKKKEKDEKNNYVDDDFDIENLKNLKIVSHSFLNSNGFVVDEPDFKDYSNEEFIEYLENNEKYVNELTEFKIEVNLRSLMTNSYFHKKNKDNKILIYFFPNENNSSIDDYRKFCHLMLKLDCNESVIISKKKLTSATYNKIEENNNSSNYHFYVTVYIDDEFFNPIEHSFNPKVVDIYRTEEEIKNSGILKNKLPLVFIKDPLVKFYIGKKGNIFKYVRKNINEKSISNEDIYYRIVVDNPPIKKKK